MPVVLGTAQKRHTRFAEPTFSNPIPNPLLATSITRQTGKAASNNVIVIPGFRMAGTSVWRNAAPESA